MEINGQETFAYTTLPQMNSNGVQASKEYGDDVPIMPEVEVKEWDKDGASNNGMSCNEACVDYMQTLGVGFDLSS
ncbi:MAG: hypothetical protein GQ570_09320 [Helicobacteraceae bacterium]|nr:hypothetical protein [Helicobacteraceae bacterium]